MQLAVHAFDDGNHVLVALPTFLAAASLALCLKLFP
jgi:hypothetical protein